jgi:hypothetical protein
MGAKQALMGKDKRSPLHATFYDFSFGQCMELIIRQHEFAPKGLGQNGLVEFGQEPRGVGVFGRDTVEPCEGGFDPLDDFLLFFGRGQR